MLFFSNKRTTKGTEVSAFPPGTRKLLVLRGMILTNSQNHCYGMFELILYLV